MTLSDIYPKTEEDTQTLYALFGKNPSSENLLRFAILQRYNSINEKLDKLITILHEGAIETYTRE